jgi:hypothetical protein
VRVATSPKQLAAIRQQTLRPEPVFKAHSRTAMAPAGKVLLVEAVIPEGTAGADATRVDITMLVFTGSRERTESEYRDLLHRAGLTLVKTTPTTSQLSILQATPAFDGQR